MKLKFDKLMDVFKGADSDAAAQPAGGKEPPVPPDKVIEQMAGDMSEQESVWWASKSSDMVEGQMTPEDIEAKKAAEVWVKDPSPANKSAAEEAAKQTDFKGPGAWAAQAAAWSNEPPAAPGDQISQNVPAETIGPSDPASAEVPLLVTAVAGSIKLAAAMKKSPDAVKKILAESAKAEVFDTEIQADSPAVPEIVLPKVKKSDTIEIDVLPSSGSPAQPSKSETKTMAKSLKPFIKLGKDISEGKNTW